MRLMMLSLAAALALTGCATLSGEPRSNIDYQKVANIENAARMVGVSVYWINYPIKSTASVN